MDWRYSSCYHTCLKRIRSCIWSPVQKSSLSSSSPIQQVHPGILIIYWHTSFFTEIQRFKLHRMHILNDSFVRYHINIFKFYSLNSNCNAGKYEKIKWWIFLKDIKFIIHFKLCSSLKSWNSHQRQTKQSGKFMSLIYFT